MDVSAGRTQFGARLGRVLGRRWAIGAFLVLGASAVAVAALLHLAWEPGAALRGAVIGGGAAALATAIGALPVLCAREFGKRTYDAMLGFGSGVMLAATAFSLIVPALAAARANGGSAMSSSIVVGAGIALGAVLILMLEKVVGHNSQTLLDERRVSASVKHAWMFVAAVALHNIPEGLAIGVAFAGPDAGDARTLATAISIQDVPEGLVVALALRTAGYTRMTSVLFAAASGLVEPLAAAFGAAMFSVATGMLPGGLALAAGAMLFVIVNNVIPESHSHGNGKVSSIALVAGFILMTILDTALT
ncbi:ZIP family metal transporter [Massilia violaceinigra]|uniref:ZIP family metal transporter n=2 Tax=Massilia TaxID=149698 RepID=A0A2D2DPH6_9BURK|nr:ZIP family metal transporter [Massilia violaceinigra]ATQ76868.1 ZIP family metal transporter [Massilia violaceinigra]